MNFSKAILSRRIIGFRAVTSSVAVRNVSHLMTATKVGVRAPTMMVPIQARFASGGLVETLSNEIASEAANDEVDQEFLDIKADIEKDFTIEDEEGKGIVILKRSANGESIEIRFDVQDEAELEMDMEALEKEVTEGDEDVPEMEYGINFEVTITKKGGEKIIINSVAGQSLLIEGVRYVSAGADAQDDSLYGGPVFEHLDEQVQDAFIGYLAERKIDENLSFFILSYSRNKEQKEYMNWLNKVLAFAEKK